MHKEDDERNKNVEKSCESNEKEDEITKAYGNELSKKEDETKINNNNCEEKSKETTETEKDRSSSREDKLKKFEEEKKKHKEALANMTFEIEDIEPKYQTIVELIGCESYKLMVKVYGGQYVYVPKLNKLIEKKKREYVYKVFLENGSDYKKTAIYCDLCITTVRKYVKEEKRAIYDKKRKEKNKKEQTNTKKNIKK